MGEAKRRRQAGKPFSDERASCVFEGDHRHLPGTVTVYVLCDNGTCLTASAALDSIEKAVKAGANTARQLGDSLEDARKAARQYVFETLEAGKHRHSVPVASSVITAVIWLLWTAPEPQGAALRKGLQDECKVVLALTEHRVHGQRAINGRTVLFPVEMDLVDVLAAVGMGPSTQSVTNRIAPH
jgi:hypothetical protein